MISLILLLELKILIVLSTSKSGCPEILFRRVGPYSQIAGNNQTNQSDLTDLDFLPGRAVRELSLHCEVMFYELTTLASHNEPLSRKDRPKMPGQ